MRKLFLTATLLILAPLTYAADDLDLEQEEYEAMIRAALESPIENGLEQ